MSTEKTYSFRSHDACQMCGSDTRSHSVIGMRLDRSQGLSPRSVGGVAVSIKRCRRCSLVFCDPLPVPLDFQSHYGRPPEDYWSDEYFVDDPRYFVESLVAVGKMLGDRDRVVALDVGAGIGKAMLAMERAGFEAHGIEGSRDFHERAVGRMRIASDRLKLAHIEAVEYPPQTFDFINCGFILEHLYSPREALAKVVSWLKPDGVMLIEVPSADDLSAKMINLYYRLRGTNYVTNTSPMHPPYHLYEFTAESFRALGRSVGFEVVRVEQFQTPNPALPRIMDAMMQRLQPMLKTGPQLRVWLAPARSANT